MLPEPRPSRTEARPGIVLGRRAALLRTGAPPLEFVPDLVPPAVFDRFCRGFNGSGRTPAVPRPAILRRCSLADVLPLGAPGTSPGAGPGPGPAAGLGYGGWGGQFGSSVSRSAGGRSALPGRRDHGFRVIGVPADSCRRPRGQPSSRPRQPAFHRFQGRLGPGPADRAPALRRHAHGSARRGGGPHPHFIAGRGAAEGGVACPGGCPGTSQATSRPRPRARPCRIW